MSETSRVFTSTFFSGNRQKLAQVSQAKLIVIVANAEVQSSADIAFRFRQDSSFRYLTGLGYPELLLVIDVEKQEEWIIGPKVVDEIYDVFNGAFVVEDAIKSSGITQFYGWTEGWAKLVRRAQQTGRIHTLQAAPRYISFYKFYSNPARARFVERIKRSVKNIELSDLRQTMAELRQIKQAPEVAAIQRAVTITANAFASAWEHRAEMTHEYQFQARVEYEFRYAGSLGPAYDSIVAGGGNACTLHYVTNNDSLDTNQLLLIDAGADHQHYSADITRTVALTPMTQRQKDVLYAVYAVQQAMMEHFKPGATRRDIEQVAEAKIGAELKKLKLITTANRANIRHYYPHALSHFLGLDVHDLGDYNAPLQPGMVMTVEPGIYIPEENIGVRIEDDILITTDGNTNLSHQIPLYAD